MQLTSQYKDSASARIPDTKLFHSAITPLPPLFSALSGPSWQQKLGLAISMAAVISMILWVPDFLCQALYWLGWTAFVGNALMRLAATQIKPEMAEERPHLADEIMPSYSVIIALYKEAALVPQLLAAMMALDYPRHRLEILFALEADDTDTLAAFDAQALPDYVCIVEVPPGSPRTKPRALNYALERATGDRIVIYDAEDRPHPLQLREAAAAFADGDPRLACLQAPLRPVGGNGFIARQFAAEYAVQFDVLLPAFNRLGLPFPLGGTSNHFKADVLKSIGAWDTWNVTEDADLGLRLAQYGYQSGLLTRPTLETPPGDSRTWLPQRTRWIKGYMQTLLVHTRLNAPFRPRVWAGLGLGVAMSVMAALCYAPLTALILMTGMLSLMQGLNMIPMRDLVLFLIGAISATATLYIGSRRAGITFTLADILSAPAYWCLQSLAAGFAVWQLRTRPFHWDKTEHTPVVAPHKALYEDKSSAYGLEDDYIGHPHHLADHRLG